jgi:multidrug efflux pump subunit AcrA (membrane-fusion protein)
MEERPIAEMVPTDTIDEIDHIIGHPPGWLSRSGISMLFIITIGVLILCNFISYPDKIAANGMVTTSQEAVALSSPKTAKIEKIFFGNNDFVTLDEPLIYLSNSAQLDDIVALEEWINLGADKIIDDKINPPTHLNIGPLQSLYAQMYIAVENYFQWEAQLFPLEETEALSKEIKNLSKLNESLSDELAIFKTEIALERSDFERSKALFEAGSISQKEFEKAEMRYKQLVRQEMAYTNNQIQNTIRKDQLSLQRRKINHDRTTSLTQQQTEIKKLLTQLESQLHEWKKGNFIFATIEGIFQLDHDIIEQNIIGAGQPVGYIVPSVKADEYYVKAECNNYGLAKIDRGARAIIKLNSYPFKEYGFLEGRIETISLLPFERMNSNHHYQVKISLPHKLTTQYGKVLEYKPNMTASIEIITKDKSILERIFEQFLSLVYEKQIV